MVITNTLIPIQSFLPSPAGIHGPWVNLDRKSHRFRRESDLRPHAPYEDMGLYGAGGHEIVRILSGNIIDIYV